ncbi:helix-turn-helix transcriptional regulator [Bradyrhizobium manausense]|uniref:ArsR/SmtB family transcription factor n=1 Tax=Bradyrhizobium manausense TaxID=989370 RepID=UPI002012D3B8|nr:metalloregulator ArsR/SmtB family transcription factor [Bradyrhizobium manausense]
MATSMALRVGKVDRILDALGDTTRRRIIRLLSTGPMSVSELAKPLDITVTAVTQHLRILQSCALLTSHKNGRVRMCSLDATGFETLEYWVRDCRTSWERRLDRLGTILEEDDT